MVNFQNKNEVLGLAIGSVLIVVLLALGAWWVMQPSWQPIMDSQGAPQSTAEIREHLMKWGVDFKEDDSSGNVLVKDSEILAVRRRLSELGIPEEPRPGLEIFSTAEYGMSEFTQRVNYKRAIEAEIAQTIRSFADIGSARVHLTIPEQSIFQEKALKPKASVTVTPRPGGRLSSAQITGISKLVSAAVENLDPADVIVLDNQGRVISSGPDNDRQNVAGSKLELQDYYETKATALVEGIIQDSGVAVAVSIEYNSDRIMSVQERLIPDSSGNFGHLRRTKRVTSSSESEPEGGTPADTSVEEEYIFSTERSEIEYANGEIERLSIGVVVQRQISEPLRLQLIDVVGAGLGVNRDRGDVLTVISVPSSHLASTNPSASQSEDPDESTSIADNEVAQKSMDTKETESWFERLDMISIYGALILLLFFTILLLTTTFWAKHRTAKRRPRLSSADQETLLLELREWLEKDQEGERSNA